jgi:hypothetical protein
MLARIQINGNSSTLLTGMYVICIAIMETHMNVPLKTKNRTTLINLSKEKWNRPIKDILAQPCLLQHYSQ